MATARLSAATPAAPRLQWAASHGRARRGNWAGYLLALPALLLVLGILAYPITYNVWLSLTNATDFAGSGQFIALANYQKLLGSSDFWEAARTSAFLTLSSAALALVVGVLTALLLWWRFWGRALV